MKPKVLLRWHWSNLVVRLRYCLPYLTLPYLTLPLFCRSQNYQSILLIITIEFSILSKLGNSILFWNGVTTSEEEGEEKDESAIGSFDEESESSPCLIGLSHGKLVNSGLCLRKSHNMLLHV